MPTLHSMDLPRPKNWQDFEDIVRDALIQRWRSPGLQKNGRPGQNQHGVDIYGQDDIGRPVAIQCKRFKGPLRHKTVETEVANAEKFESHISALYIATTAENDAKLQQAVRILSDKRVASGMFAVGLLFWDDIIGGLILNPTAFNSHYPQIPIPKQPAADKERLIAALEFGYYGAYIWQFVLDTFGEFGWLANADPDDVIVIVRIIEQRAAQLLKTDDRITLLESCAEVRRGCASPKQRESDWDPVEQHAKRVQNRVKAASSLLPNEEARVLELALALGRIYHHVDDKPEPSTVDRIESQVRAVLPETCTLSIDQAFATVAEAKDGFRWAPAIYTLLNRELRWL